MIESWDQLKTWQQESPSLLTAAEEGLLLPFFGAAISQFKPTSLPLGKGLLLTAMQGAFEGVFPSEEARTLFPGTMEEWNDARWAQEHWTVEETAIARRSPEVLLQGLAEGLPDRQRLASFYNKMLYAPPNPLHFSMIEALEEKKVPAIFTTNQDHAFEDAVTALGCSAKAVYDASSFGQGLHPGIYQFHGAIGGDTVEEKLSRQQSLTFTLNSMGPRLPDHKRSVLEDALSQHTLLFLGYSGADPDIWYTLYDWFSKHPESSVYWCVRPNPDYAPSGPLFRLQSFFPDNIRLFTGDIFDIVQALRDLWGKSPLQQLETDRIEQAQRLAALRNWIPDLPPEQRELTYGWLLVSVGQHKAAAERLERLAASSKSSSESAHLRIMASLFAGFARREMSEHHCARRRLKDALLEAQSIDRCRYAQALHKYGESLSTFESIRFWHWWPQHPRLHNGAAKLNQAIKEYDALDSDTLNAKQISRTGKGNALMNLGQLYRRVAAVLPRFRQGLRRDAQECLERSQSILENEGDMRALAMVTAALAADNVETDKEQKLVDLDRAIDLSELWNQDDVQIGSAYFAKAQFLAHSAEGKQGAMNLEESEKCYWNALAAFRRAGMNAEIVRTLLDFAGLLNRQARYAMAATESSWEWQFGLRVLGVLKALRPLLLKEIVLALVIWFVVIGIIDSRALFTVIKATVAVGIVVICWVLARSILHFSTEKSP